METSEPMPFEQPLPQPESADEIQPLPPQAELNISDTEGVLELETTPEALIAKDGLKKTPEAVLAHVEEAAKRGEAQEAFYELSHENKDEAAQPMASVGSVAAGIASRNPAVAKASQHASNQPAKPLFNPETDSLPEVKESRIGNLFGLYKRPILIGFSGALVVLALVLIYSLITN